MREITREREREREKEKLSERDRKGIGLLSKTGAQQQGNCDAGQCKDTVLRP